MVAGPNPAEGSNSPSLQIGEPFECRKPKNDFYVPSPRKPKLSNQAPLETVFEQSDISDFNLWLKKNYQPSYAKLMRLSAAKYAHLLHGNLAELERLTPEQRNAAIKALSLLAKFRGCPKEFKQCLSDFDLKLSAPDSLQAFKRMVNASNRDTLGWVRAVEPVLSHSEQALVKLLLYSGLRVSEGILAFNKIIELNLMGKLGDYYNRELNCLMHYQYPKEFCRRTKNAYLSFLPPELIAEIASCQTIKYNPLRKKLERHGFTIRLKELRSHLATYLLNQGLLHPEIDLLEGRIGKTVFMRNYFTPQFKELGEKTLLALKGLNW